jgi:protein-disulfide isomerase
MASPRAQRSAAGLARPGALALPVEHLDHILGPASAPVTVLEYGDFECPACRRAHFGVKMLLARFGRSIRFAYRHFPLLAVHPRAELAAQAAEAAGAQGKFWPMHDLLFENQPRLEAHHLRDYARRLELDLARYDYEMTERFYLQRVREHAAAGEASGVRSAPAFFLNGVMQDVSFGFRRLLDAVQARLGARASVPVPGGVRTAPRAVAVTPKGPQE